MTPIQSLEEQATDFARRGDFGVAARQVNEELTKAAPANAGAWTRLGRCCLELGQLDEATAALETALQLNAQNTIASSLQQEVGRRRARLSAAIPPVKKPRASAAKGRGKAAAPIVGGFGRPEFATLAQLPAAAAVEALGPRIEAILMALNDRPFGDKIVEARNRAGHAGGKLFRRNSFYPGAPAISTRSSTAGAGSRSSISGSLPSRGSAGAPSGPASASTSRRVRSIAKATPDWNALLANFERFQLLLSSEWRQLLTDWMGANGGFIQTRRSGPSLDLLPKDAVNWLATTTDGRERGWVFCGRWLFADRPGDAEVMENATKLTKTIEQTFTDLLPLWMSVYRGV